MDWRSKYFREGSNRVYFNPEQCAWLDRHHCIGSVGNPAPVPVIAHKRAPEPLRCNRSAPAASEYLFTISTQAIDRMGDSVAVDGWHLDAYRKNPVVLCAHNSNSLPVGRATSVWRDGYGLRATVKFANTDFGRKVESMVRSGMLNATSVGFKPLSFTPSPDRSRAGGIDFKSQELLEFSIVPVPANSQCLLVGMTAGKSVSADKRRRQRELDVIRARAGT
jgi:HK97 family phage prohead protease